MADRPNIKPNILKPIINNGNMTDTLTSIPMNIQFIPGISFDIIWTGTPTGVFNVQVSNTYTQNPDGTTANAGNWTVLPTSSFSGTYPTPSGSADNGFLDVVGTEACWIQIVYIPSGGSGTLTVTPCAKVF